MLLTEMEIFYYVVTLKSFSQAADKLGFSKSYVSKSISKLEKELQVKLLTRSTRQLTLTEAGNIFYQYCANIVNEAEKSHDIIGGLQAKPSGVLKISAPPAFGNYIIAKVLPNFLKNYPDIRVNIELENRLIDMIAEGYDLAFRAAVLQDSNLIARKIVIFTSVLCASPNYLHRFGVPKRPEELSNYDCCIYNYGKNVGKWVFSKNKTLIPVKVNGKIATNQLEFIKKMILEHQGLAILPKFMIEKELKEKKLTICLPNYQVPSQDLFVLYPHKEFQPLKVKLFLTALNNLQKLQQL